MQITKELYDEYVEKHTECWSSMNYFDIEERCRVIPKPFTIEYFYENTEIPIENFINIFDVINGLESEIQEELKNKNRSKVLKRLEAEKFKIFNIVLSHLIHFGTSNKIFH